LLLFEQEEYDWQLAEAIQNGSTVDHTLSFRGQKLLVRKRKESYMVLEISH
jgi:hypothetical protein